MAARRSAVNGLQRGAVRRHPRAGAVQPRALPPPGRAERHVGRARQAGNEGAVGRAQGSQVAASPSVDLGWVLALLTR